MMRHATGGTEPPRAATRRNRRLSLDAAEGESVPTSRLGPRTGGPRPGPARPSLPVPRRVRRLLATGTTDRRPLRRICVRLLERTFEAAYARAMTVALQGSLLDGLLDDGVLH